MKKKLPYLLAVLSLFFSSAIAQTTYYVSTSGDDGNGGTNNTTDALATIQKANDLASDGDIIEISDGIYTEKEINTNKSLTIMGSSPDNTIIQATATEPDGTGTGASVDQRIFKITGGKTVTIKNMTLRHGNASGFAGSAVFSTWNCHVIIESCNLFHNYAQWNGGAVAGSGPSTTIKNSSLAHNSTKGHGGAIAINGSGNTFTMENCTVFNNASGTNNHGGGILLNNGASASFNNNTIAYNVAASRRAIYVRNDNNSVPATAITQFTNNLLLNVVDTQSGVDIGHEQASPFSESTLVKNNIISQTWYAELTGEPNSTTGKSNVTPALVDLGTYQENGNGIFSFSISETSIATDAGDSGTAATTDTHGTTRDASPSVGAYEYVSDLSADSFELESVGISPNPSNGSITIHNLDSSVYDVTIYGINGTLLYTATQTSSNIEVPNNIKGLVFIKISTGNSAKVFKHLIQ